MIVVYVTYVNESFTRVKRRFRVAFQQKITLILIEFQSCASSKPLDRELEEEIHKVLEIVGVRG